MISEKHKAILEWYESLTSDERAAIDDLLITGDPSLVISLRESSERLNRFYYLAVVDQPKQLSLEWW